MRRIREIGGTAVIAEDEEPEVRGDVQQRGWRFSILKLFSRYFFYFLIGERITEKEGLETFIKKDYKVYTVRHYITSKPFYHSQVYASNAQTTYTS